MVIYQKIITRDKNPNSAVRAVDIDGEHLSPQQIQHIKNEMVRLMSLKSSGSATRAEQILEGFWNCNEIKNIMERIGDDSSASDHAGAMKQLLVDKQIVDRIVEVVGTLKNMTSSQQEYIAYQVRSFLPM